MMSDMSIAKIDKIIGRDVSENVKQTDSRYELERNSLLTDLSENGILETVAIHEAGHEHYYAEAGAHGFTFVPPVILFRPKAAKPFKKQMARIVIGGYDDRSSEDDKWLLKLAKGYAAGGECSISLPSTLRYRGDESDRKRWYEMCVDCYKAVAITQESLKKIADEMWDAAQKEIRKELHSPTLNRTILTRADEIKPLLFPWLSVESRS
jgi:hypothetical protein